MKALKKCLSVFLSVVMLFTTFSAAMPVFAVETGKDDEAEISGETVENKPEILYEITDERTANTKSFMQSDGTRLIAQYSEAVHYENADGEFSEYDNSLSETDAEEGEKEYKTKASDIDIRISKKTNGKKLVRVTKDKYTLSWNFADISKVTGKVTEKTADSDKATLENMTSEVVFDEVFSDTDLQYIFFGDSLKENIILNSKDAPDAFTLEYKYSGLTPILSDDKKTIYLNNSENETVFVINAPYMEDANGEQNTNIYYETGEIKNNQFSVTLITDKQWLDAENRAYPVTVDPIILTVKTKQDIPNNSEYGSATIASGQGNSNYGSIFGTAPTGTMYVGYESTNSAFLKSRSLIKFMLPELFAGDRVVNAQMYCMLNVCSGDVTVNVHRVTSSWKPLEVLWSSAPSYEATISDYTIIPYYSASAPDAISFDITRIVNGWYTKQFDNNGIILISPSENSTSLDRAVFYASGYPTYYSYRPQIAITVRNMSGLEDCYSYSTFNAGTAGTAYVNNFTGNLVFMHNDMNTTGMLMPVSLSGVYNTTVSGKFPATYPNIGRGKKLNVQQTLRSSSYYGLTGESLDMFPYAYEDGDGTIHYFYKKTENGTTTYIDEDGLNLELTVNSSSYIITDKDGNKKTFSSDGLLVAIANADGMTALFEYDGVTVGNTERKFLSKITDGAGHIIDLEYETAYGYLTKITGPDGKSVEYSYTNQLNTGIKYADGSTSLYSYDAKGALTYAKAADGYNLNFTYSDDYFKGIETVTEKGGSTKGQYVKITRKSPYQTVIRDSGQDRVYANSDDIRAVYQFDTYGRVSSVKTELGSGELVSTGSYDFTMGVNGSGTDVRKRNRLEAASATGKTANNLLVNHSFESSGNWVVSHWLNEGYADNSTADCVSTEAYMGAKSLKVTVNSASVKGGYSMYQDVFSRVQEGKTYTASAYIKTNSVTKMGNVTVGGAGIGVRVVTGGTTVKRIYSDTITGTTNSEIDNGWQRVEITFTVPENTTGLRIYPMVYSATGTAYFDCIQLEEGTAASNYNLLVNSDFEYSTSGWSIQNGASADGASTAQHNKGSKSFLLTGESDKVKSIYQSVNVSGTENDTYIVSGFAKANAVPFTETNYKRFAICIKIWYTDNTYIMKYPAAFNCAVSDWQNVSGVFTLSDENDATQKTPESIVFYCGYYNQANTSYFDDVCLIKEPVPTYKYDNEGNLISAVENAQKSSALSYDVNDNLTGVTDEKNVNYTYTYGNSDNPHRLTSATDNITGIKNNYEYFANGSIKALNVTSSDGLKIRTSVAYTTAGSAIAEGAYVYRYVDEHGRNTYYDYNKQSGLLNNVKDANGNYTYYTYNTNNGLVTSVSSGNSSVDYSYDSTYTRLSSITHNGFNYGFTYDAFGNMLKTTAGGNTLVTNTYSAGNGLLTSSTYGNGDVISYVYDAPGRVTGIKNNGVSNYAWTYSGSGVPNSYTDNVTGRKYLYTYDSLGRLIYQSGKKASDSSDKSFSAYKYDISNNLTEITNSAGTLDVSAWYYYDNVNRPTKSYFNNAAEHRYEYDGLGRLQSADLKLSSKTVNRDFTYYKAAVRNSGSSSVYQTTQLATETLGDREYSYTYDNVGNITKITEKASATATAADKVSYTYDALGQLTRENNKDLNKTIVYSYDNGGNITSVKEYAYTTAATPQNPTKTVNYTYDGSWKDKLTKYGSQTITYDSIGNPLTYRDGMSFTWYGRQMKTANVGGTAISYKYNADGLRTEKTVGSTVHKYEYTGSTLFYENRGGMQLHYRYDVNGNLASITRIKADGTKFTLYAVCNSRGDVEELRTLAGALYARYIYDSWGNTLHIYDANGAEITSTANLAVQNPIRYRGYYFDTETGLYYLQSRYYDPVTCRFLNADSISDTNSGVLGYNIFAYCANNPNNLFDPSGHSILLSTLLSKAVIGAAIGAFTNIACQVIENQSFSDINWKSVAIDAGIGAFTSAVSFGLGAAISKVAKTSRVLKAITTIAAGGLTKTLDDTCKRIAYGEEITLSNTCQSFANGSIVISASMGVSALTNKISFNKMTKAQKHSALNLPGTGDTITHRDIKNGLHKGTMNNYDFLTNKADQIEIGVSFFTDIIGG